MIGCNISGERGMAAERIQQNAMCGRVEQAAIVSLAVDFDKHASDLARELEADGRIVDKGAAAAIGGHRPAQDDLVRVIAEIVLRQNVARGMASGGLEDRHDCGLIGAGARAMHAPARAGLRPARALQAGSTCPRRFRP